MPSPNDKDERTAKRAKITPPPSAPTTLSRAVLGAFQRNDAVAEELAQTRKRLAFFYMAACAHEAQAPRPPKSDMDYTRFAEAFCEAMRHDALEQVLCDHCTTFWRRDRWYARPLHPESWGRGGPHSLCPCARCPSDPASRLGDYLEGMSTQFLCQGHRDGILEQLRNVQYILREDQHALRAPGEHAAADPGLNSSAGERCAPARSTTHIGCRIGRGVPSAAPPALGIVLARGFLCRDRSVEDTLAVARKRVAHFYIRLCGDARCHEPDCISAGKALDLLSREGTPPSRRDAYWHAYASAMRDAELEGLCKRCREYRVSRKWYGDTRSPWYMRRRWPWPLEYPCSRCPHPVDAVRALLKAFLLPREQAAWPIGAWEEGHRDGLQEQLRNAQLIMRT